MSTRNPLRAISARDGTALRQETFTTPAGQVVPTISSTQNVLSDGHVGPGLDLDKWQIATATPGSTINVTDGLCSFVMGTAAGESIVVLSRQMFTVPFTVEHVLSLSQRIANQNIIVEMVSVNEDGTPNELNRATWEFPLTVATQAHYSVREDGATAQLNGPITVGSTTAANLFGIEVSYNETRWYTRTPDSINGRNINAIRNTRTLDPGAIYKVRVTVINTDAVASATTVNWHAVRLHDAQEVLVEVSSGRGGVTPGEGIPVNIASSMTGGNSITVQGAASRNSSSILPIPVATAYTAAPTAVTTGRNVDLMATQHGVITVKPFTIPELDWQYVPAAAIANTTDVVIKASGGTGLKNYITGLSIQNSNATATEFVIKDGAVVIWRHMLPANMPLTNVSFPTPIHGSAATALNVACVTTGASVYVNLQGYVAP